MSVGFVVGCDIGSQGAKAVLLSPDGEILGVSGSSYSIHHPREGWSEQDPQSFTDAISEAVRALIVQTGVAASAVSHLALASQVDGLVASDSAGRPLRNAIIWMDRRATAQSAELEERLGGRRAFELSGLNLDASHGAPKMMWFRDNEPEIFSQTKQLGSVGSFVATWLSGHSVHDHANASSTLLYDLAGRDWSDELLDAAGLDRALLPEIAAAHDPIGALTATAAESLGLSTQCVVVTGTGDEHAACVGASGLDESAIIDVVGTAEVVAVSSRVAVFDPTRLVETHAHAVEGHYLIENPGFLSGGGTMWLAESVLGVTQADLLELATQSEPGARGVRYLPTLSGAMAPRWNEAMRGAFYGLSTAHTRPDLARAVIEGNCFAFRDIADRLGELGLGGPVRVVGGGARSQLWLEVKATVCGRPLRRVLAREATATGAAMLASVAAGTFEDLAEAAARVVELAPAAIDPDESLVEIYEAAYRDYRALYDALEQAFAPQREDSR